MPWPRSEPDPLQSHRKKLDEKQRALNEEMSRLTAELEDAGRPVPETVKPVEPPVWRLEEDTPSGLSETPARRKALAHQRGRDRLFFFLFMGLLFVAFAIWMWVYQTRALSNTGGM